MTGPLAVLDSIDPMGMTPEQAQQKLNQVWMERQLDTMQDQVDDFLMETEIPIDPSRPRPLMLNDWEREAQTMIAPISVIPTPFPSLNDACRRGGGRQGWRLGWHIVLAGAPGFGKTTVALNCAVYAALKGKKVGILSLEMGRDEIMAILLSIATKTHEKLLEATPGQLNQIFLSRAKIFQGMLDASGGAIFLIDLPRSDLKTVERAMRQMIEDGVEFVVVDFLQRIQVLGKAGDYERMTEISNSVQAIAKQNNIVTLALSQFNRGTTSSGYSPKASGMKGSSSLEEDAVQVVVIDQTAYHRLPDGSGVNFVMEFAKNRKGPLTKMYFHMSYADLSVTERQA